MKANLGDEVRDLVTGLRGIVIGRTEYINGCVRYIVQPQGLTESGKPKDSEWVDEQQLDVVQPDAVVLQPRKTGGPQPVPKSRDIPF